MSQFTHTFDERLCALTFTTANDSGDILPPATCPPIIFDTLSLLDSASRAKTDLIVSTPAKESFGQVLATLLALDYQLDTDEALRFADMKESVAFKPGDKLKMGNAVVEYVGPSKKTGGVTVRYNPKMLLKDSLPIGQSLLLQKTDSKRGLSPTEKFNKEKKKLEEDIGNTLAAESIINELKRKKTYASATVVYVGSLNRSSEFCMHTLIDGTALNSLILCNRVELSEDGKPHFKLIGKGQHSGTPSLAIAYDLMDVVDLEPDKRSSIKAVIIDKDNYDSFIERNIEQIWKLQGLQIPMFAIVSNANSATTASLRSEGFKEWRWDERTLDKPDPARIVSPTLEDGFFYNLSKKSDSCSRLEVQLVACEDEKMSTLQQLVSRIDDLLGDDCGDEAIETVRLDLLMVLLCLLHAVVPYDMIGRLPHEGSKPWRDIVEKRRGFIPIEARETFVEAFDLVDSIINKGVAGKEALLARRIDSLAPSDKLTVVLDTVSDTDTAKRYWRNRIDAETFCNITFIPFSGLKAMKKPVGGRMVICGWLGKKKMLKAIYSYNAAVIELMLYRGCETDWYINQSNVWKCELISRDDAKKVLGIPGIIIHRELEPLVAPCIRIDRTRTPVEITEERWKLRTYSEHEAKGSDKAQSVEAIPVRFAGGYISFYRDRSALIDITPIIEPDNGRLENAATTPQAKRQRVGDPDGLHEGSFVLLREKDKDVLEQLADQLYLKGDALKKRRLAQAWREGLEELYIRHRYDARAVYDDVRLHGMDKTYQAFRALREDEDKIAPGRNKAEIASTVTAIARALYDAALEAAVEEIASAALDVQNAHRNAGKNLSKRLDDAFSRYLVDSDIAKPDDIWEPIIFDLNDLGDASVYRIVEVDREHKINVAPWKIGKIYEE